jgi:hypothetical protein
MMTDKEWSRLQDRINNANRKMTSAKSQEEWNYWNNLKNELMDKAYIQKGK